MVDLWTPVFQLSWLKRYWWKYWIIISNIWSQCPQLDSRESGTPLWLLWHVVLLHTVRELNAWKAHCS